MLRDINQSPFEIPKSTKMGKNQHQVTRLRLAYPLRSLRVNYDLKANGHQAT